MPNNGSYILLYVIGAAVLYMLFSRTRSRKRNLTGKCARCGVDLAPGTGTEVKMNIGERPDTSLVCPNCARTTAANHKVAYYVFVAMSVILVVTAVAGIVCSAVSHELRQDKEFLASLIGMSVLCVILTRDIAKVVKSQAGSDQ